MMTLAEKIAQTPKLERIDSSIESCIKILEQELTKRAIEAPDWAFLIQGAHSDLLIFKDNFNVVKGKK